MILGGVPAGDLSTFLKQWNEMGMKGKIPICEIAIGDTDIWSVGPEAATGPVYVAVVVQESGQSARRAEIRRGLPEEIRQAGGGQGVDGLDRRQVAVRIDRRRRSRPKPRRSSRGWKAGRAAPRTSPYLLAQGRPPDAAEEPGGEVKPKITDKWDYFDVKGMVPKDAADLDKRVRLAGGQRLPHDLTATFGRASCSTFCCRRWPPGWCSAACTC